MQVNLSWTAVEGALYYRVYRSPFSGGPYQIIGNSNPNPSSNPNYADIKTTYQDGPGNLFNGQSYYYRVSAVTIDGESPYSVEFAAVAPNQPNAPTNVSGVVT